MEITEYRLTLECKIGEYTINKELIYRGNENIIINQGHDSCISDDEIYEENSIRFPRHILEKFIEMINDE